MQHTRQENYTELLYTEQISFCRKGLKRQDNINTDFRKQPKC